MNTDTPRTDACPHCGAEELEGGIMKCHSYAKNHTNAGFRSMLCREREKSQKLEAEVERLREALDTLTLIVGLTPVAGNKEALQEAFNLARKALNTTNQ